MGLKDQNLPLRSSPSGDQIDTRPMQIEEWLDSLPYTDFKKTSQLLFDATLATNRQQLKPSTRLELVELYNRPYQYYIDSQIKAGAQHTLQSIDTVQTQIKILKNISANLALACKISAEDILNKKTLWGQTKPPIINFFLSLNFLSHALIFSYLEYAPTPKNVWKEINFIYDFAESLSLESSIIKLPDNFAAHNKITTIAKAYKRIILASMSDPHHLPYGAIWEIYEQLANWVDNIALTKFTTPTETSSRFVIKLDSDSQPIPIIKFNSKLAVIDIE
jgi:cyclic-di-GMP-binding protein